VEAAAYNMSVTVASGSFTLSDLQPAVFTEEPRESQTNVSAAVFGLEVFASGGTVLGADHFTSESWTSGGSTPLVTGDTLSLLANTGAPTEGAVLDLVGSAPTTGVIGILLE
jgi:hypothetical protein